MNIAVVVYSRHLSRWRRRGLTLFSTLKCDAPNLPIYINASMFCVNHSWSSFIYRRSEFKGFYESLQIAFPNNLLFSQFHGWSLVCTIDIYIHRCLIMDCFYGPRYILESVWESLRRIDCVRLQVIRLYIIWIFIDYYGECETWLMSQCIWSGRIAYLHISMACSALHRREGRSQQSSLAFKATWY